MKLTDIAVSLLNDAKVYLLQVDREAYREPIPLLSASTIGQHSRHFIEFYQCLLEQVARPEQCINYDARKRNRGIEEDPLFAASVIDQIIDRLQSHCPDRQVRLSAAFSGDTSFVVDSSYERELMYNIEHTIHHMAILKIGLKIVAPALQLPEGFGVAGSTIKFHNSCAQ